MARDPTTGKFLPGHKPQNKRHNGGRKASEFSIQALIDDAVSEDDWRRMIARRRALALGEVEGAKPDEETRAFKELADRRWGKAKELIDVKHEGGLTLIVERSVPRPPSIVVNSAENATGGPLAGSHDDDADS